MLFREETLAIADELGIKHPQDSETQAFTVITTDFLVIIKEGDKLVKKARTIKPANELTKRNIVKFEIERIFWAKRNVDWKVVTDKDINVDYGMNLEQLRGFSNIENMVGLEGINSENIESMKELMLKTLASNINLPIQNILHEFDRKMYLDEGTSISIFNHFIKKDYTDVSVHRYPSKNKEEAPIAVVDYHKYKLRFILLTSCYHSGHISKEVRDIFEKENVDSKEFENLICIDKGEVTRTYLSTLFDIPTTKEFYSFGIIHHNPIRYGNQTSESQNADLLLGRLFEENNVKLLFHGHTHLVESKSKIRNINERHAFPIPAPTLSGEPMNSITGFNVYFVNSTKNSECKFMAMTMKFDENDIPVFNNDAKKYYFIINGKIITQLLNFKVINIVKQIITIFIIICYNIISILLDE